MGGPIVKLFRRRVASTKSITAELRTILSFCGNNVFCFWDIRNPYLVVKPRLIDLGTAWLSIEVSSSPVQSRNFPRSLAIRQRRNGGRCLDSDRPSVQGQYDAREVLRPKMSAMRNRLGSRKCRGPRSRCDCSHRHDRIHAAAHSEHQRRGWTARS